jgi:hypothetical protein
MPRLTDSLLVALLLAACGGESESRSETASGGGTDDDFDACALLTPEEIQAATGWAPDTTDGKTYGTTKTCNYMGADALKQSVVLIVARPAPKVSSSAELAERRTKAAAATAPEMKMVFTPIEGMGMPAVRSEVEGSDRPMLEAVVGPRVLSVTTSDFEATKALVSKAAARLR